MEKRNKETAGSFRIGSAKVIEVIETISTVGSGTEADPNRFVTKYWSLDGELLAVNDQYVVNKEMPPAATDGSYMD